MSTLITGGTGFIGPVLARLLLEHDVGPIVLFDLFPNEDNIREFRGEVTTIRGDFAEATELARVLSEHAVRDVFHLAYMVGHAESNTFPARAIRTNCSGTNAVFECAMAAGVRRVLWPSSAAVQGATVTSASPRWHTEDDPATPDSLYGACKLFNEHVAELHHAHEGFDHVALRLSSVAGPGRADRRGITPDLYATILERSVRGEQVVTPPADHVLTWGYVEDAARAFYRLYAADTLEHRIYNFAGPVTTVGEVTDLVRSACPGAQIEHAADAQRHIAYLDARRLAEDLDFSPAYSLQEAIADHLERIASRQGSP